MSTNENDEEFYKNNYHQMKDVEDFGDKVFIKANFFTPRCVSQDEGYIHTINDLGSVQSIINRILSAYDLRGMIAPGTENIDYTPMDIDQDFLSDEDKELIIKSINQTIFNKIQLIRHRQSLLRSLK